MFRECKKMWIGIMAVTVAALMLVPASFGNISFDDRRSMTASEPETFRGIGEIHWNGLVLRPGQPTANLRPGLHIVQFRGPVMEEWLAAIAERGMEPIWYIPNYAFLVNIAKPIRNIEELEFVTGILDYSPDLKISNALKDSFVMVTVLNTPTMPDTVKDIMTRRPLYEFGDDGIATHLTVNAGIGDIMRFAGMEDVLWIAPAYRPEEHLQNSETESEIIGGGWAPLTPYGGPGSLVNLLGWNGSGITISLCDGGIGDGIPGSGHADFQDRLIGGIEYRSGVGTYYPAGNIAGDGNSHGTHCAGCFGADGSRGTGLTYPNTGYYVGYGSAPDCTVFVQRIFSGNWGGPNDLAQWQALFEHSYENNIDICSFSWGTSNKYEYDYQCVAFDRAIRDSSPSTPGDQQLVIFKSAGNDGTKGIVSPGWAKNLILVGGTQNYYPDGTSYGCPQNRNNIDAMYPNSARGPTGDNRIKPDVLAPADYTLSTRSSATPDDGAGLYTPDPQDRYNWNIGTSFSGPYGAGSGACIMEWYETVYGMKASPALVRALLINSAKDISGSSGGVGDIPNYDEGWGRIYLPNVMDPPVDVSIEDQETLLTTGQTYTGYVEYDSPAEPMKITLTWVDPAGSEGSTINIVNNLNLKVTAPDGTTVYRGNAFSGGYSQAGMASPWDYEGLAGYDSRNNVECVYISSAQLQAGEYTVEVYAENVPVDAVSGGNIDQDFALVIYNALGGTQDTRPPNFAGLQYIQNPGTGSSLKLVWEEAWDISQPITYHACRFTSPPSEAMVNSTTPFWSGTALECTDSGLTPGMTYYYVVRAEDAIGNMEYNMVVRNGIPEDLVFFQVQSPAAGYKNLNQDPFETGVQLATTAVIDSVGEHQIDAASGKWRSDAVPYDSDLNGTWRFYVYGNMNNDRTNGYLYAKVLRHSDSALLFTTGYDVEDVSAHTTDHHQFLWSHTVPPGILSLAAGDRYYVELWLHVTEVTLGTGDEIVYDFSSGAGSDKWYYNTAWTMNPPTGYDAGGFQTESSNYPALAAMDGTLHVGSDAGNNRYAAVKTVMTLNDVTSETVGIEMLIRAQSDSTNDAANPKVIYAWNHGTSSWVYITEGMFPGRRVLGTISGTLDSSVTGFTSWNDFLDASNRFTWLAFSTTVDGSSYQTRFDTDYVKTTVVMPAEPDGVFAFAYDSEATPSAVHPEIPSGSGPSPEAYDIDLTGHAPGDWVFVSFPIAISGNIQDILNDPDTTWDVAKGWDNQNKIWNTYRAGYSATLSTINNQMGVWLHLTANGDDQMLTTSVAGYYPFSAVNINLYTGWNMVGYPSTTNRLASATLPAQADMVSVWQAASPYINDITALNTVTMSHGNAYWVHVTANCAWTVQP